MTWMILFIEETAAVCTSGDNQKDVWSARRLYLTSPVCNWIEDCVFMDISNTAIDCFSSGAITLVRCCFHHITAHTGGVLYSSGIGPISITSVIAQNCAASNNGVFLYAQSSASQLLEGVTIANPSSPNSVFLWSGSVDKRIDMSWVNVTNALSSTGRAIAWAQRVLAGSSWLWMTVENCGGAHLFHFSADPVSCGLLGMYKCVNNSYRQLTVNYSTFRNSTVTSNGCFYFWWVFVFFEYCDFMQLYAVSDGVHINAVVDAQGSGAGSDEDPVGFRSCRFSHGIPWAQMDDFGSNVASVGGVGNDYTNPLAVPLCPLPSPSRSASRSPVETRSPRETWPGSPFETGTPHFDLTDEIVDTERSVDSLGVETGGKATVSMRHLSNRMAPYRVVREFIRIQDLLFLVL